MSFPPERTRIGAGLVMFLGRVILVFRGNTPEPEWFGLLSDAVEGFTPAAAGEAFLYNIYRIRQPILGRFRLNSLKPNP